MFVSITMVLMVVMSSSNSAHISIIPFFIIMRFCTPREDASFAPVVQITIDVIAQCVVDHPI